MPICREVAVAKLSGKRRKEVLIVALLECLFFHTRAYDKCKIVDTLS